MWRHNSETQGDRSLWCCNILMLMSWLSPRASVTVSSLILTNTPEYWAQWVWMIVTNELPPPLITAHHTPSHTLGDPRILFLQASKEQGEKIIPTHKIADWELVWKHLFEMCVDSGWEWLCDYSWLSRDNKRRRGANTGPWQQWSAHWCSDNGQWRDSSI